MDHRTFPEVSFDAAEWPAATRRLDMLPRSRQGSDQKEGASACPPLGRLLQESMISSRALFVPRQDNVYNSGDRDGGLYLVVSGQIKTATYTRSGKTCLLGIFGPGHVFGELALILPHRIDTATAMRPAGLRKFALDGLVASLDSGLLSELAKFLAHRLADQQQMIAALVTMNSEHRLGHVLAALGKKLGYGHGGRLYIEERITQEELSDMVGTTRSRIGLFLGKFHEAGIIEHTSRSRLVLNEQRLADYLATV